MTPEQRSAAKFRAGLCVLGGFLASMTLTVEATNVTTQATGQASSGSPFTFTNGDAEQVYGQLTYDC